MFEVNFVPLISVIIPVYNAEKYICQCLNSLINQTFKDFEIICVDDGSTDRSLLILESYEKQDPRIHVLKQKKLYAGIARNTGMSIAQGKYYIFLDADDFFDENLLFYMWEKCEKTNADLCICNANKYDEREKKYIKDYWLLATEFIPAPVFNRTDIPENIFYITTPSPWNLLIKAEFINKFSLKFQGTQRSNDLYFTYAALALADKITVVDKILVHYRIGLESNLQSNNEEGPLDFYLALQSLKQKLEQESIFEFCKKSYINMAVGIFYYNFLAVKKSFAFEKVYEQLKKSSSRELELERHEKSYFINFDAYHYLKKMTKFDYYQDYLFFCMNENMKKYEEALCSNNELRNTITKQQLENQELKEQIDKLINSVSFKMGRLLTFVPRKLRDFLL